MKCMNHEIEGMLLENGASMVGFAKIDGMYNHIDLSGPQSADSVTEAIDIPHYPFGISIILAKGAINPRQIGLKLDNELTDVKNKLGQLKNSIIEEFGLARINDVRWEEKRNKFINAVYKQNPNGELSENSQSLLKTACSDPQGTIIKTETLDGTSICVGKIEFITSQERREVAKWEDSLRELLKEGYIEEKGSKGEKFVKKFVKTFKGYDYISDLKALT